MTRSSVALAALAVLAAGCPAKKDDGSPSNVHDDVWVSTNAGPARVIVDGNTGWVVNSAANSIDAIDLTTCTTAEQSCQLIGTTNLPESSYPFDATLTPGRLHVVLSGLGQVVSVDTTTRQVVATITTGAGALYSPQAVASVGGGLWVADSNFYGSGPGFVARVTGTAITGSSSTTQLQPGALSLLPDGDVAVTNLGMVDFFSDPMVVTSAGGIDILDGSTGALVDNIDLGLVAPAGPVAVSGTVGYVVSSTEGTLLRVDLMAGTFSEIEVASAPAFLTWVQVINDKLYVLSSNEDLLYVLDAATGDTLDQIRLGPGGETNKAPSHIAVWEDADGVTHLLIALYKSNSVTDVVIEE